MEYDKLLTQKWYLNDHKFRLIIVPEPPDTPLYTNHALYAVPTRHAAPDTSEDYDSDVSQKGLRGIWHNFAHLLTTKPLTQVQNILQLANAILPTAHPTVNLTANPKNINKTTIMTLMLKFFLKSPISLGGA